MSKTLGFGASFATGFFGFLIMFSGFVAVMVGLVYGWRWALPERAAMFCGMVTAVALVITVFVAVFERFVR